MNFADVVFLDVDDVEAAHAEAIAEAGGDPTLRDRGLLESAVMQPRVTFEGVPLYSTLAQMAAAYLVGIAQNHAFVDGNKRAAVMVAATFLRVNGFDGLTLPPYRWERLVVDVTRKVADRDVVAAQLVIEMGEDVEIEAD